MKTVRNFICCLVIALVVALAMLIPTASLAEESETNSDSVPWTYLCEQIAAKLEAVDDYFNESIIDGTLFTMEVLATIFAEDVDIFNVLPDGEKMEGRGIDEYFAIMQEYSHYNFVDVVSNAPLRIHVINPYTAVLMRDITLVTEGGVSFDEKNTWTLRKHLGRRLSLKGRYNNNKNRRLSRKGRGLRRPSLEKGLDNWKVETSSSGTMKQSP